MPLGSKTQLLYVQFNVLKETIGYYNLLDLLFTPVYWMLRQNPFLFIPFFSFYFSFQAINAMWFACSNCTAETGLMPLESQYLTVLEWT